MRNIPLRKESKGFRKGAWARGSGLWAGHESGELRARRVNTTSTRRSRDEAPSTGRVVFSRTTALEANARCFCLQQTPIDLL